MLPHGPDKVEDFVSVLIESVQKNSPTLDENKQVVLRKAADNKSLLLRTFLINSPHFGAAVLECEKWESLMRTAKDNMSEEVADVIYEQGMAYYESYMYSFASKSSETIRDSDNSQSSLTHLLLRDHMEKTVTIKDKAAKGLGQAIGLRGEKDDE